MFLDDTLCWLFLRKFTALVGYGEIRRICHDELFEETVAIDRKTAYLLDTVLVGVSFTAPPLQSRFAPRIFLQQHFKRFIFPLKAVSLQTHHLFGNIFRQERNTILLNASRDRLIGLDTLNGDTVFLFKEVQMLLSCGVFKPRVYPEILDLAVLIDLVNQVKDNIAVRAAADTAHGIIRPHQDTLCLAHTGINGVVIVIGTLVQSIIKHCEALPRCEQSHRPSNRCRYTCIAGYWKCLRYSCRGESASVPLQQA